MNSRLTLAIRKPIHIGHLALAAVALLILCSPGLTAGAQSSEAGSTSDIDNKSTNASTQNQPEATCPAGGQCFADVPSGNSFYESINRIYMQDLVTGYPCGGAGEPCDAENRPYYRPAATVNRQQMAKFIDNARRLAQIRIVVPEGDPPIYVRNVDDTALSVSSVNGQAIQVQSQNALAIYGQTGNATAIHGFSTGGASGIGVSGSGPTGMKGTASDDAGFGVWGVASNQVGGIGVYGEVLGDVGTGVQGRVHGEVGYGVAGIIEGDDGTGVLGIATGERGRGVQGSGGLWAGWFNGNINVTGNCTGCAGPTKIDHPLDPEHKYLYHSSVQSPDMKTIYDGVVTLDANGEAEVVLPEWFEALNKEFRYQFAPIGAPMPNLYIAEKIKNNRFKIAGGSPGMEVSWMVTGIRHDPYANAHPILVEEDKPADEQGKYLHPTEYGQPESLGVDYDDIQESHRRLANP